MFVHLSVVFFWISHPARGLVPSFSKHCSKCYSNRSKLCICLRDSFCHGFHMLVRIYSSGMWDSVNINYNSAAMWHINVFIVLFGQLSFMAQRNMIH